MENYSLFIYLSYTTQISLNCKHHLKAAIKWVCFWLFGVWNHNTDKLPSVLLYVSYSIYTVILTIFTKHW